MQFNGIVFAGICKRFPKNSNMECDYVRLCPKRAYRGSIEHFRLMLAEGISSNIATIASILLAYSHYGDMQQAKNLHCYPTRTGFLKSIEVTTGLIDVYVKAACLDIAWTLFNALSVKDFVSWSAMIGGYGMHGHVNTAILLLYRMVESGVEPDEVSFTSLLYSCNYTGLVDEGLQLFSRMLEVHRLRPHAEHYVCVVDLLRHTGRLEEAYALIRSMPWGALLGACAMHGNVELGEAATKRLFKLESKNTGNYVLLGNIYAVVGMWEDAEVFLSNLSPKPNQFEFGRT